MHHKGNLELFCLSDRLPSATVYIKHSHTVGLSRCQQNWFTVRFIGQSFPALLWQTSGVRKSIEGNDIQRSDYSKPAKQNFSKTFQPAKSPLCATAQLTGRCSIGEISGRTFCKINGCGPKQLSFYIKLNTAFLFFLIPFSHAMCRANLCWPCAESRRL